MKVENITKPRNVFRNVAWVVLALVSLLLGTGTGRAAGTAIPIADYNFSGSFSSWTTFGNGSEGQYIPTVGGAVGNPNPNNYASGNAPPGGGGAGCGYSQYGYGVNSPIGFSQTLTNTLTSNTVYTLSGYLGNGYNKSIPYSDGAYANIQLLAGTNVLASTTVSPLYNWVAQGTFGPWSVNYTAPASGVPSGTLQIVLGFYNGNDNNYDMANWADIGLTSSPAPVVTSSQNPSLLGGTVTFTATVTGSGVTPTGTVTFMDGTNTLGTGTLNGSGVATFSTTQLSIASHSITAVYGGDSNYTSGTSTSLAQVVNSRISLVQTATASSGSGNSATATFSSATTAGNLLVVAIWGDNITQPTVTITDNSSGGANTYADTGEFASESVSSFAGLEMYYAKNIKGGNTTVTVTLPSNSPRICVYEIAGADTVAPLNAHTHISNQGSAGAAVTPTITPYAGDMVIAVVGSSSPPGVAATPFTLDYSATIQGGGGGRGGACAHDVVSAGSSLAASFTPSSGNINGWSALIAGFTSSGNVPINNRGFEADALGNGANTTSGAYSWASSGTYAGALHYTALPGNGMFPQGSSYPNARTNLFDGVNIAYISGGLFLSNTLSATLGAVGTTYTLSGVVAHRNDYSNPAKPYVQLFAGNTVVVGPASPSTSNYNITDPALDSITNWSFTYTVQSGDPVGQTLKIVLGNVSGDQISFDGLALTYPPIPAIGPANAYKIVANATNPAAGASDTITITQVDSSGNTETGCNGTTNLTFSGLSAGPDSSLATVNGTSLGTATAISFTNGVATTTLVAHDAQTATLNVTDGTHSTTNSGGAGVSLTVSAGTASAYRLTGSGQPQVGVNYNVTVTLVDQYQNVSSFGSTKSLTFNTAAPLSAGTDGSAAQINGVNQNVAANLSFTAGVGTAVLVAHKAESSKVITVTDGTLTSATTGGVTLTVSPTAGADSAYRLTGSGQPQVGVNYTVNVTLVDKYQNVSSTAGTKSMTFNTTATLSAGADGSAATINGVAQNTAANVTLTAGAGSVVLVAHKAESSKAITVTDGTLTSAGTGGTTLTVSPTAGADSAYRITAASGTPVAGASDALTITLVDKYQNLSSYSGDKTLTFSGLGNAPAGTVPTVTSKTGAAVNLGTSEAITFASGTSSAGGSLVAYKQEGPVTLAATDGTLSTATTGGAGVSLTVSAGTATRLVITGSGTQTAGASQNLTITAEDASGNTATTYTGSKNLTFSGANSSANPVTAPTVKNSSGTAVAFGSTTAITFSSGVATVSSGNNGAMTLYKAESATISVTDSSISSSGSDRLSVTVSAATASTLVYSTQPGGATAGSAFSTQPVVVSQDAYGNNSAVGLGTSKTVTIAIKTGTGTLQGTTSYDIGTSFGNGTITGNSLRIDQATSFTLSATVTSGLTEGDSSSFTVSPASASVLVFTTQPGGATAGSAFGTQPVVKTQDAYGNNSTVGLASSKTVTIAIKTGTGTLQGTTSYDIGTGAGNGTITGIGLRIDQATSFTLSATVSSGLTEGDSTTFTVSPAAASKLVYATAPVTVTAGAASGTITVQRQDAYNNPNTTDATISVALSSGSSGTVTFTPTSPVSIANGSSSVSFTYTDTKAGSPTITAHSGSLTDGTQQETVIPGALDHFVVTTPGTQAAGTAFAITTITAQDANNNTVTNFTGAVDLSETGGGAGGTVSPSQSGAFTAGVLSSQSVTLTKAASGVTITATDHAGTGKTGVSGTFTVNAGALDHFAISAISSPQTAGTAITGITLTAQDVNNNTVTSFNGSGNTVAYSGTAGITGTSATFSSGVLSSVSVTPTVAGSSKTLIVTGGSPSKTGTSTFDVNPGSVAAAQSTVSSSPGSVTADGSTTSTITVTLKDANNNPVSGKTVTLGSSRGATDTISAASGSTSSLGVVTFTVKSTTAGAPVFTATDTSDSVTVTQTGTVTFTAGTATKLVYSSVPSTGTAGTAFSVTVQSQDANGNPSSPTSNTTITLSKASGAGSLSGTLTGNILTSGNSVTISTPVYSKADTMTLTATATAGETSLAPVTSGTIAFSAGAATQLAFTSVPGTGTAGTPFSVTVQSQDANGNPSSPTSTTTVTLSKATGGGALSGTLTGNILTSGNSVTISTPVYSKADTLTLTATATSGETSLSGTTSSGIAFSAGAVSAAQSTVAAAPGTVTADGVTTSTITVTLNDTNNNPVAGKTVTLGKTSGSGAPTIATTQGATDTNGVATFTVKSTTAGADVFAATDASDSIAVTQTAAVTFTAGAASAAQSTVSASPTSVTADGSTMATITVTLKDAYNNLASGRAVTLAQTAGSGTPTIITTQGTTDGSGVATFTVKSTTAAADVFTATDTSDTVTVSQTATVTFTPGAVTAAQSTASASPASVTADGATTATITVTLKDAHSNPVSGKSVSLAQTSGSGSPTISATQGTTDTNGVATFTVKSTTAAADVFTATDTTDSVTVTPTATVTFTAGTATKLVFTTVPGTGTAGIAFSVTVQSQDANGNPSSPTSATTITLSKATGAGALSGTLTGTIQTSGNSVTISTPVYSKADTMTLTATATAGETSLVPVTSGSIAFSAGAATQLAFTSVPGTGTAGTPFSVTVQSQDANGNPASPTSTTTVTLSRATGGGTLSGTLTGNILTSGNSVTIATPVYSKADTLTLTATATAGETSLTGVTSGGIAFSPGAVTAAQSTVAASPSTVTADGSTTSTITVTLNDANNNPVSGKTVTLGKASGPGSPAITTTQGTTGTNGVATFLVKSTTAGADVFAATDTTDSNLGITQTATVTFTAGAASAALSTVSASPTSVTADGVTTATITVTLEDANTNLASGRTVALAQTSGAGSPTISTVQGITDTNGVATFTVKSSTAATDGFTATDTSDSVGITQTATVTFTVGAVSAAHSALSPATASITANGVSTTTLTVQARDANNNNLTTGGATVVFSKSSGIGSVGGTTDNGNGTYTATVTSPTTTGSGTFTATLGGTTVGTAVSASSSVVAYTAGAVSATHSTVAPATASITADGSSTTTITVQARDANNNNLTSGGATVVISKTAGAGTLSGTTDNGNGTYTATVTAPTATGSATFAATLNGTAVGTAVSASSSVVTYTPGSVSAAYSTISPATATLSANGTSTQLITIQARDANSNNLTSGGASGVVSKYSGGGSLGSTTDNGNGTYTATVTAPSTAGSGMFVATLGGVAVGTALNATNCVITYTPVPNAYKITAANSSPVAGTSNVLTITIVDQNGYTATGFNGTETMQFSGLSTSPGGNAPTITDENGSAQQLGNLETISFTNGVSTAVLIAYDAQSSVFVAASGGGYSTGRSGGSVANLTVSAAAPSKLVMKTEPSSSVPAGAAFGTQPAVYVEDAYGNVVTTDSSVVRVSVGTGTGPLTGTTNATASSGVATFSGLDAPTLAQSGLKLTFSDPGDSLSALNDTTSITVNAAIASKLVFTSSPVTTAAGVASGNITVRVQDQYGNPATTNVTRTVTLASSSTGTVTFNPASLSLGSGSSSASFTYTDSKVGTPTITAASTSPSSLTSATQVETVNGGATTLLLTSSGLTTNHLASVTFTATVQVGGVTATGASGTVQFVTNSVNFGGAVGLTAGAASTNLATLPRGTNYVYAIYSGDANYLSSTSSILNEVITNNLPVANPYSVVRTAGLNLLIYWSNVATNWSDADGYAVSLAGMNLTTANGGTVTTNSTLIKYHNATNNANDQITYTITNGQGDTGSGVINVVVNPVETGQQTGALTVTNGVASTTFFGFAGFTYQVQRSTNLTAWVSISTNTVGANGLFNVTDNFNDLGGNPPASAYYRLEYHP